MPYVRLDFPQSQTGGQSVKMAQILNPQLERGSGQARRPQKTILIGDFRSSNIGTIILDYLKSRFVHRYRVSTIFTGKSDEILAVAARYEIDVFILVLNNLMHTDYYEDRLERSLEVSALIQELYNKPVIALSGWLEDGYGERAKSVSDVFFPLPPRIDAIADAFQKCLEGSYD